MKRNLFHTNTPTHPHTEFTSHSLSGARSALQRMILRSFPPPLSKAPPCRTHRVKTLPSCARVCFIIWNVSAVKEESTHVKDSETNVQTLVYCSCSCFNNQRKWHTMEFSVNISVCFLFHSHWGDSKCYSFQSGGDATERADVKMLINTMTQTCTFSTFAQCLDVSCWFAPCEDIPFRITC